MASIRILALESFITVVHAYVCVFPYAVNTLTELTAMRKGGALIEGFQTHTLINTPSCDVDTFTPQTFKFGHEICFGGNLRGCYDMLKGLIIFRADDVLKAKQGNSYRWFSGC